MSLLYDIPRPDVIRKREYSSFLKTNWYTLSDTDRAIHILEESELFYKAHHAEQFLNYYERKYILQNLYKTDALI